MAKSINSIRNSKENKNIAENPEVSAAVNIQSRSALSGWPMLLAWLAMMIFAFHASTHMVGAGDTWVAMACGRHFINHGVNTVEPFSTNTHKAGPTKEEIKTWPNWAQWITNKAGIETVKYWHPTGWVNQNWLTHVIFYYLTHLSPFADAKTLSFNTLVYWKFAIYILTVICVYYTGRLLGSNPALSAVFACLAMFVGRSFFDIRPAGFSNLLVAVFLLILVLATYRNILYIWLIVPMTVFWCNLHGGYIYVFIMLAPFVLLHLITSIFKKRFVSIGLKGVYHTFAAGFVTLVASIVFNPFHLTNFTHTYIISASKHAKMWRTVNEWHPAFAWQNPVGTGFPFLVLFILSIGLAFFWLFSRFLKPKLLKAPKDELEAQEELFKVLSTIFGFTASVFVCWITFISFSFVKADAASFFLCTSFVCILLLSIYKSVHFIYLTVPLILLSVGFVDREWLEVLSKWFNAPDWLQDIPNGYLGRYIYSFVILPTYVTLGILTSIFSKTAKIKPKNIIFVATTAVVALSLIAIIFNPFKFGFLFNTGPEYQHHLDNGVVPPYLWQQFEGKGIPLSQKVAISVEKPGSRWSITDESKKYSVRKEESNLSISKYESESPVWLMGQLLQPHRMRRMWNPEYEKNLEITYQHLFSILYIINFGSVVLWLALPSLRKFLDSLPNKICEDIQIVQYKLPKIDLPIIVTAALTIYMAYRSRRFIPIAAIVACPVIAMLIDQVARTISATLNFYKNRTLAVNPMPYKLQSFFIFVSAIVVITLGSCWGLKFKHVYLDSWPTDAKLKSIFIRMTASHAKPFDACNFIRDNKLKGKMFNYWTEGGFIAWGQEPDPNTGKTPLQLFMDGRAQAAYEPRVYDIWRDIMSGGPLVEGAMRRRTTPDYLKVGQWIIEQLRKNDVWVVLMPLSDSEVYNGPFIRGLESDSTEWPVVFFNNTEKLFIDLTTPQGKELFEGIYNGKTLYPDEFSKSLIIAYHMLGSTDMKKGLEFAVNAFKLYPSQASMQVILYTARNPELQPFVIDFCKKYFDEFATDKVSYEQEDGYLQRMWAALLAGKYLRGIAVKQEDIELVQFYDTKIIEYMNEQGQLHTKKRW